MHRCLLPRSPRISTTAPSSSTSANKKMKRTPKRKSRLALSREEKAELRRLSQMLPLPARTSNPEEDPCRVLHDTAFYISHLMATVHARVKAGTLPPGALDELSSSPSPSPTSLYHSPTSPDSSSNNHCKYPS